MKKYSLDNKQKKLLKRKYALEALLGKMIKPKLYYSNYRAALKLAEKIAEIENSFWKSVKEKYPELKDLSLQAGYNQEYVFINEWDVDE